MNIQQLSAPLTVAWRVTVRCNLRCLHCFASAEPYPRSGELDDAGAWAVLRQLEKAGVFYLIVTGGEPLLREGIFDLMEAATRCMRVGLNTNATLVTDDIARRLADLPVRDRVSVSLDGSTAEIHDRLRGSGAFDLAVRGIEAMVKCGLPVRPFATVTALNWQDLPNIARLSRELGGYSVEFNALACGGHAVDNVPTLRLSAGDQLKAAQVAVTVAQDYEGFVGGSFIRRSHAMLSWPRGEPGPFSTAGGWLEQCGVESCAVLEDGSVAVCEAFPGLVLGNLRDCTLADIWQTSPVLGALRQPFSLEQVEGCRECGYRALCTGGCRGQAYLATGDIRARDPVGCLASAIREAYAEVPQ